MSLLIYHPTLFQPVTLDGCHFQSSRGKGDVVTEENNHIHSGYHGHFHDVVRTKPGPAITFNILVHYFLCFVAHELFRSVVLSEDVI